MKLMRPSIENIVAQSIADSSCARNRSAATPIIGAVPIWARLVVVAAGLRVTVAVAFYLAGIYNTEVDAPLPAAAYAALVVSFSALGLLLVVAARNDVRAAWLGGVLLLVASPLTSRFLAQTEFALGTFLSRVQTGAFLPAFLWCFVREFPSPLPGTRALGLRLATAVAIAFGAAAFAINLSILIWPPSSAGLGWRAWLATGQMRQGTAGMLSIYWPAMFLTSAAAAIVLVARMFRSEGDDRTRVRIFVSGLALGLMPIFVQIAIEELWPPYARFVHQPGVESWFAALLFGPMALVPLVTTYSVLYDRVVNTRLVIRAAIQHALAKYTIGAATLIPFVALVFYVYQFRSAPLATLLSGPRPLILAAAVAVGGLSLRSRKKILYAIDRRFFREVYDAHLLVTALVGGELMTGSPAEIAANLRREIDRTLHTRADLFVLDEAGARLQDPSGTRRALDAGAMLVSLALADAHPLDVNLRSGSPLMRLPDAERAWIESGPYALLMAVRSRDGGLTGFLALTAKRSELPFSPTDRRIIGALAGPLGLALENERLRRSPDTDATPPARECQSCSRLHASGIARCGCGGALAAAAVPHVLRGVFRFDRRIGAGGMGVVYRATDISLKREVAIKTLPRVTAEHAARLKREAQAMASMNHPNLAVIYGIESWRGTPFLVEEYLGGGTLADRLRGGPMAIGDALALGSELAAVVGDLHASGIVHCDIKPSNIGFSYSGVMKLVDFGIASMLRGTLNDMDTTETIDDDDPSDVSTFGGRAAGTPAYMSPEALMGARPSPSVDLWALSVVVFEAIAGQRPYAGRTRAAVLMESRQGDRLDLLALRQDCPEAVARFFDRSLAADTEQRPRTAADLRAQLQTLRASVA
jgi:hypothetical protein